jgi:hypothetical protein
MNFNRSFATNRFSIGAQRVRHPLCALAVLVAGCGQTDETPTPLPGSSDVAPVAPTTPTSSNASSAAPTTTLGTSSSQTTSSTMSTTSGGTSNTTTQPSGSSGQTSSPDTGSTSSSSVGGSDTSGIETTTTTESTDSAASDTSNTTTSDTATSGPVSPSDCADLLLCEDFEGGVIDPAKWSLVQGYNYEIQPAEATAIRLSSEQKHGGAQALRVDANGLAGVIAEIAEQKFYLRAHMRLDAVPVGPVLVGIGKEHGNELRFRIQHQSSATINIVPGDAVLPSAATTGNCPECVTLTANEWFCMEFLVDAMASKVALWVDGAPAVPETDAADAITQAWPATGPVKVRLGSMDLQGGMTGVWFDDVAIGTERIGCE